MTSADRPAAAIAMAGAVALAGIVGVVVLRADGGAVESSAEPVEVLAVPPERSGVSQVRVTETALAGSVAPVGLVRLQGGEFTMGESRKGEDPHRVRVSPFAICATEVSAKQYELVMGSKPVREDADDIPARLVSWYYALKFMNALTRQENTQRNVALTECYDETTWAWDRTCTGYRLPTEAEWEYAARADHASSYSFGEDAHDICKHGNVQSQDCKDGYGNIAPVQTVELQPNAWGLHGVHGNVWEWVYDSHDSDFDSATTDSSTKVAVDPVNIAIGKNRVIRGGSFASTPDAVRSASRDWYWPEARHWFLGFRCARGAGNPAAGRGRPDRVRSPE